MNKINSLFAILVAALVCIVSLNNFNTNYATELRIPGIADAYSQDKALTILFLDTNLARKSKEETIDIVESFFEDNNDFAFMFYDTYPNGTYQHINMFLNNYKESTFDHFIANGDLNLLQGSVTNDLSDTNASAYFDFLDDKYYVLGQFNNPKISYYDFNEIYNIDDDPSFFGLVYFDHTKTDEEAVEKIFSYFGDFLTKEHTQYRFMSNPYDEVKQTQDSIISLIFTMPNPILFISSISLFIISLILIVNREKEILIRNLHGNKMSSTFWFVLRRVLITNILSFLVGLFVLSYIMTNSHGTLYLRYLKSLMPYIGIYFLVLLLSLFIIMGVMYRNRAVTSLKATKKYSYFEFTSLLKILVVAVIAVPLIRGLNQLPVDMDYISKFSQDNPTDNYIVISSFIYNHGEGEFLNVDDIAESLTDKYELTKMQTHSYSMALSYFGGIKGDKRSIGFETMMKSYFGGHVTDMVPMIETNSNILTITELFHLDGSKVSKEDLLITPIVYLVPEGRYYEGLVDCNDICRVIKIKDGGDIYTTQRSLGYPGYFNNPLFKITNNLAYETSNIEMLLDLSTENGEEKLESLLNDLSDYQITYTLSHGPDISNIYLAMSRYAVNETLMTLFPTLVIIVLFSYFSSLMYFDAKKKVLLVQYLHGSSYLKRYGRLLISNAVSLAMSLLLVLFLSRYRFNFGLLATQSIIMYYVIVIVLDLIVSVILINGFERRNISQLLKGDEI